MLYKPFRFFFLLGTPFFLSGSALITRWVTYHVFFDGNSSKVPSLLVGIGMMLVAVQLWIVAFVADLIGANRRLLSEIRLLYKQQNEKER